MSFKRKVFYLSGFDPRGARHYHALYEEQAARYAALSGEAVRVSTRRRGPQSTAEWDVRNDTADVETAYSFLAWDDLIRREWITNPTRLLWATARTYAAYVRRADWQAAMALQRGPLITLFYPPVTAILLPLLAFLVLFGLGAIGMHWALAMLVALLISAAIAVPLLKRLRSFWLLRFFIFNDAVARGAFPPALSERLDGFAALIDAALDEPHDEVLLVTHSNGSILAVPLMERLIARRGTTLPDKFALVTLGQCTPLLSLRADADHFRRSLAAINEARFRWVDIGSPPDGAAYTQTDPFAPIGGVKAPALDMISARIFKFHDPASYAAKRKNKYEFHFEYLRCGDTLSPIDHPSMTAGPRPLAAAVRAFRKLA